MANRASPPYHEHPTPADQIGEPPRQKQEASEKEDIDRDHPLETFRCKPELSPHRWQGDNNGIHVQNVHELRYAQQGQRPPSARVYALLHCGTQPLPPLQLPACYL